MRTTLGWLVFASGLVLLGRSTLLLVGRGRPRRGPTPAFVIAGPYRRMRNPQFVGLLIALTGLGLVTHLPALGTITVIVAAALRQWVVWIEEPRLRTRFGKAYEAYLLSVPRWIPRPKAPLA
jgi:protein-S-isoprenylcysteine O-methyltransferase Ste14